MRYGVARHLDRADGGVVLVGLGWPENGACLSPWANVGFGKTVGSRSPSAEVEEAVKHPPRGIEKIA